MVMMMIMIIIMTMVMIWIKRIIINDSEVDSYQNDIDDKYD